MIIRTNSIFTMGAIKQVENADTVSGMILIIGEFWYKYFLLNQEISWHVLKMPFNVSPYSKNSSYVKNKCE